MSGAEAGVVLGLISSAIAIVQATKQVYDAAHDIKGLPKAFHKVAKQLPLVKETLHLAEASVDDTSCAAIKPVIESCGAKAGNLRDIFEKVFPDDNPKWEERYFKALHTLGKGSRVEDLMKDILNSLKLLSAHQTFKVAAKQDELLAALNDLANTPSSAPDQIFEKSTFSALNLGSGTLNSTQGDFATNNFNTGNAPQFTGSIQEFKYGGQQ